MGPAAAVRRSDALLAAWTGRVERALDAALSPLPEQGGPPRLHAAMTHAVFGGGGRLRPALCLAVASACGDPAPDAADAAAAAIELMHCASLVHDDLPCFDDAQLRRGKPTVHAAFGVPLAVLAGDALIVLAFAALARPHGGPCVTTLARATGPARGIVAGQAWESEPTASLDEYHRAKTASLFEAAAVLGAQVAGADADEWRTFGETVGRAYQAADDVLDAIAEPSISGKTPGRDTACGRPSVVRAYGLAAARRRVSRLLDRAAASIPSGYDEDAVRAWLDAFSERVEALVSSGAAQRG